MTHQVNAPFIDVIALDRLVDETGHVGDIIDACLGEITTGWRGVPVAVVLRICQPIRREQDEVHAIDLVAQLKVEVLRRAARAVAVEQDHARDLSHVIVVIWHEDSGRAAATVEVRAIDLGDGPHVRAHILAGRAHIGLDISHIIGRSPHVLLGIRARVIGGGVIDRRVIGGGVIRSGVIGGAVV